MSFGRRRRDDDWKKNLIFYFFYFLSLKVWRWMVVDEDSEMGDGRYCVVFFVESVKTHKREREKWKNIWWWQFTINYNGHAIRWLKSNQRV